VVAAVHATGLLHAALLMGRKTLLAVSSCAAASAVGQVVNVDEPHCALTRWLAVTTSSAAASHSAGAGRLCTVRQPMLCCCTSLVCQQARITADLHQPSQLRASQTPGQARCIAYANLEHERLASCASGDF
jgi:hypothetical protein